MTLFLGVFLWWRPIALAGEEPCKRGGQGSLLALPHPELAFLQNAQAAPQPWLCQHASLCPGSRPSGQPRSAPHPLCKPKGE